MIGESHKRVEDRRLVTGQGAYTADLADSATVHCWFVRSPVAHGMLRGVDTEAAADAPGVLAVFTAADFDLEDVPAVLFWGKAEEYMKRPLIVRDRIRHVGEPLAIVVAETARQAEDAAELVWPDIDELDPVVDPETAATAAPLFDGGSNVVMTMNTASGPEPVTEPEVSATVTVVSSKLAPVAIETNGAVAEPAGNGVRAWIGHQAPHRLKKELALLLKLDPGQVRVTVPDVGGGFGMKGRFFPEYALVAATALKMERKVSWVQTRREHFATGTHGRGMRHRVTLEGTRDGRIQRAVIDLLGDVGAYPHNGSQIPIFTRLVAAGLYDIPRMEIDVTVVVTNTAPVGSYRGAGRPEAALAIERAIDAFAREAGLDAFEVRRINLITDLPFKTPTGALYDSGDYRAAIDRAAELLDLPAIRREQEERRRDGRNPIGVGLGAFVERAGGAVDSGEYAKVEVIDGTVVVRTGSVDTGQGHHTVWEQVARSVFGDLPVTLISKDTAEVADGVGTYASRSAQVGASAVQRVAGTVLDEAKRRASQRLEVAEEDIRYDSGVFTVAGVPDTGVSIFDLVGDGLEDEEMFVPGAQTFPYGAHGAVVEVCMETGEVKLLKLVAVDDCGTVLNPMIVEGQVDGSLAQGLGQAFFEEVQYDSTGQPLTASMMDYPVPHAPDFPVAVSDRFETPAPSNPLGAKGTGEAGCIGAPAAVLNAAIDALWPHGVRELQIPLRPERVWRAIQQARARG
ncbi:MAG: xanthine dehydrogenase family protein molybdopterin-binding subunit [Acidimicrobiia bacterium]|nr:xanthine dehydrogenase family protein molybdopterin-binding subunit [Acidimicrobiia bacterium]